MTQHRIHGIRNKKVQALTAISALAASIGSAFALELRPASEISPRGTTVAARPALQRVVLVDTGRRFRLPDGAGGFVTGTLQDSVSRSNETGTLIFEQRVILDATSSAANGVAEWTRTDMRTVSVDADYMADGLGDVKTGSSQRSGDGTTVRFKLVAPLRPGQSSYFNLMLTNATKYAATGVTELSVPGVATTVRLATYRPVGAVQPYYTATRLGYASNYGVYLNDRGQISMTVGDATGFKAVRWQPNVPNGIEGLAYPIPRPAGFLFNEGMRINSRGQIAGSLYNVGSRVGDHSMRAFLWTPGSTPAAIGSTRILDPFPGGTYSGAWDVNALGQVVGGGDYPGGGGALMWNATGVYRLGRNGFGSAYAINRYGKVAGFGNFVAGTYQGLLWTPDAPNGTTGTVVHVDEIGGANYQGPGVTSDINDNGVAVGAAQFNYPHGPIETHGYLWSATGLTDLGNMEQPFALNNAGVAVGSLNGVIGTVYREGVRSLLRNFVSPAEGWRISWTTDVNNSEQITGAGYSNMLAQWSQILMTPVRIRSVSPNAVPAGTPGTVATIRGLGYRPAVKVTFDGADVPTTRVDSTTLLATIPASMLDRARTATLVVWNPDGTQSNACRFAVGSPSSSC